MTDKARVDLWWLVDTLWRHQGGPIWSPLRVLMMKTDASGYR